VAYLEAKLKTTSKALKDADAARASANKAAKATEARASKAEKDLVEVAQKQAKHEGCVVKRLDEIVTSIGSKFFILPLCPIALLSIDMLLAAYLYFCYAAKQLGEVMKLCLESTEDPLLDSVDVFESNWRNV
jgi:Flp pilus assembly protein TadB